MTKISKKPYPGISEKERKTKLAEADYSLRKNKQTSELYTIRKKQSKKS